MTRFKPTLLLGTLLLALSSTVTIQAQSAIPNVSVNQAAKAAGNRYDYDMDVFHPVYAKQGMVASEQGLATQVGLDILKQGGNAVDAAVATGFALAVVLPNAGNIGGGGFMMVHDAASGKNIALDFWKEQLSEASPGDYVFSSDFKPGKGKTTPKHMSNKWKEYVKEGLGIDIDFYSLKHLNLDEVAGQLDAEAAAKMAGHTSTVITLKHYLINEEERKMEKLRRVNNDFA